MLAGQTACLECKSCDSNGSQTGIGCPGASAIDLVDCQCNAGYFGDGIKCLPCTICHPNATTIGACELGTVEDIVACSCNAGYVGDGMSCTKCLADGWLLNSCEGANQSLIQTTLWYSKGSDWCLAPTESVCTAQFPAYRAFYAAGIDSASIAIASAPFVRSYINQSESQQMFLKAFRKHASGYGTACTVKSESSSCLGNVPLLSVPGFIIASIPGELYLRRNFPDMFASHFPVTFNRIITCTTNCH